MKKIVILLVLAIFCSPHISAQGPEYARYVQLAEANFLEKNFLSSAENYEKAFATIGGKAYPSDRLKAAESYSLAGNADKSLFHLFQLAEKSNYNNLTKLKNSEAFKNLHGNPRWNDLLEKVRHNAGKLNSELIAILDTVQADDQKYRAEVDEIVNKYGPDSKEMKDLWKKLAVVDSINLLKVSKILDQHGWPGTETVGSKGATAIFLVIQHADLQTQEKYLPLLKEAVKKGRVSPTYQAYLEDRMQLRQNKKQIYGTQLEVDPKTGKNRLLPLLDPKNVDKRREAVGLGPLEEYLEQFGMVWNPADEP